MKRKIYVYQEEISDEIVLLFESINDNIVIEEQTEHTLTIVDTDFYNEEPVDLWSFHELLEDDFNGQVSLFIEPYSEDDFPIGEEIKQFLPLVPKKVYTLEDIIPYIVINKHNDLRKKVIQFLEQKTNKEVIHTVREFIENNMNSSQSAKKLYMHRNTLNYRLDNFVEATGINVRTFKGANAIYMLFTY